MMVGSIETTVSEGDFIKRGQEFGYFAFGVYSFLCVETLTPFIEPPMLWVLVGGSTIVCLFEKNVVEWDEDLLINGRASLETLVRVGMGIGRRRGSPAPLVNTATYSGSS
jgi:phosphatidylserine decarboxylase